MPVSLSLMLLNLIKAIRFTQGRVAVLLIQVNILQLNRRVFEFIFSFDAIVADCNIISFYQCIVLYRNVVSCHVIHRNI